MLAVTGKLENWKVFKIVDGVCLIWGNVYGDSKDRFVEGARIHTSAIKSDGKHFKQGDIIDTMYSIYLLGAPLEEEGVTKHD
jgi:hypothetical protein